jgi:flagellar hook-associated protein 3 FlgL
VRITEKQIMASLNRGISQGWSRLGEIQGRISSGVRVEKPSDDPLASVRIGSIDRALAEIDRCQLAAREGRASLEASEGALAEMSDLLIRARELAVQGASDQYSAEDRQAMALEVEKLREQALALANTQVGGRYIFSGAREDTPAFDAAGNYQGDALERELEVAPGLKVAVRLRGDTLLGGAGGGVNVFTVLSDLQAALSANDGAAVRAQLGLLEQAGEQISQGRARAGSRLNLIEGAQNWNGRLGLQLQQDRSAWRDTDLASASLDLALAQKALEASVLSASRMLQMNFLNRF